MLHAWSSIKTFEYYATCTVLLSGIFPQTLNKLIINCSPEQVWEAFARGKEVIIANKLINSQIKRKNRIFGSLHSV